MAQYTKDKSVHYYFGRYRTVQYSIQYGGLVTPNWTYTTPPGTVLQTRTFTGEKNPKWRSQVRRGINAGTPASGTRVTMRRSTYSAARWEWNEYSTVTNKKIGRRWRLVEGSYVNCDYQAFNNTPDQLEVADNKALTSIYNQINSEQRGLQAGVAMGELGETLRMIRNPAQGLSRGLGKYLDDVKRRVKLTKRRRNPRGSTPRGTQSGVTRANRAVADLWLEHSFGWVPLLNDIDGAFQALTKIKERDLFYRKIVRKTATIDAPTQWSTRTSLLGTGNCVGRFSRDKSSSVRYIVCIGMEPRTLRDASLDSFGLRPGEFIPTIWELIPYSFLIDYFTNVGDVLSTYSVNRSRIKWIIKTTRIKLRNELRDVWLNPYASDSPTQPVEELKEIVARPAFSYESTTFQRSAPPFLNVPTFEFEIPGLSSRKWLNIAALVRGSRGVERAIRRSL